MNRAYPVILLLLVAVGLSSCGLMLKCEVKQHKKLYQDMHDGRPMKRKFFDLKTYPQNRHP